MSLFRLGTKIASVIAKRHVGKAVIKETAKHFKDPANVAILGAEIAVGVATEAVLDKVNQAQNEKPDMNTAKKKNSLHTKTK